VADYGLPQAVIDRRDAMFGHQRGELRKVQGVLDKMSTLTRAEAACCTRRRRPRIRRASPC
jgi:hypothetical protein